MEILQKIMEYLPKLAGIMAVVIPAIIAFNAIMSSLSSFFHAIHLAKAEQFVGKVSGVIAKVLDFLQANVKH